MNPDAWCKEARVSRSNYYYRKRRVQESNRDCDEQNPVIVKIDAKTFQNGQEDFVDLEAGNIRIRVTDRIPMDILHRVFEVIRDS